MNKYLVIVAAGALVLVGGYFLLTNQANQKIAEPNVTQESPTPESSPITQTESEERKVNVTKAGFEPEELRVKVGTKVIWENKSGGMANVSSVPHPIHTLYPFLNLGNFDDGESVEVVFEDKGTYEYHNHLNSSQTGTVVVE